MEDVFVSTRKSLNVTDENFVRFEENLAIIDFNEHLNVVSYPFVAYKEDTSGVTTFILSDRDASYVDPRSKLDGTVQLADRDNSNFLGGMGVVSTLFIVPDKSVGFVDNLESDLWVHEDSTAVLDNSVVSGNTGDFFLWKPLFYDSGVDSVGVTLKFFNVSFPSGVRVFVGFNCNSDSYNDVVWNEWFSPTDIVSGDGCVVWLKLVFESDNLVVDFSDGYVNAFINS